MNLHRYDNLIKKLFIDDNSYHGLNYKNLSPYKYNRDKYPNIEYYFNNRFEHITKGDAEVLYRLKYGIELPVCPGCGKILRYNKHKYVKMCRSCKMKDPELQKHIHEKSIARYGSLNNAKKISESWSKLSKEDKDNAITKRRKTCKDLYGEENFVNVEKAKQTCLDKYGYTCSQLNPEVKKKTQQYYIDHYGVDHQSKVPSIAEKISDSNRKFWTTVDDDYKQEMVSRVLNTKDKNHTHNTSKPEIECYEYIKTKFPDTLQHKRTDKYNFNCDFYIPSIDVYIEYQGTWTHGEHPFDTNNNDDLIKLEKWKNKHTKYYNIAIKTWTVSDPLKRKTAQDNNLNWYEVWNKKEFTELVDKLYIENKNG